MTRYVLKRCGAALIVMFVVSLLTFIVTRVLFPDPAQSILGGQGSAATAKQVARLREQLGLDQPLFVQYFTWVGDLFQGDLGRSFRTPMSVTSAIAQRLPVTIELMVFGLAIAIIVGMLLGVAGALARGRLLDGVSSTVSVLALSLPNFFVGILLIYVFALKLQALPSGGWVPITQDLGQNLQLMVLPAATLSLAYIGTFARYARALMISVLSEDYVLRAHASGLSPRSVVVRHAIKNTSIPMVTVIGLNAAGLVGGAVVTESVFSLPGLGTLFTDSLLGKDFPVLQGLILVITIGVVVINLLVDLAYGVLDPRIKVS